MSLTTTSRLGRLIVTLAAVMFAAVGLGFWVAPEQTAYRLGLEAVRATGLAALRADFGGLFLGLALLCATAVWTKRRAWFLATSLIVATIAVGRVIGWAGGGVSRNDAVQLGIELTIIAASIAASRTSSMPESIVRPRRSIVMAGALVLLIAASASLALLNPTVVQAMYDRAAERLSATQNTAPLADDGLRVGICGSSAPLPSAPRAKACVAVFAGSKFYVVDSGPESTENLVLWGIPLSAVGGVLLTHFHSDHIGDLGELNLQTWAGGRPAPLAVYGGPGVERVVEGFNEAYRMDQGYRTTHHTDRVMPAATWPMVPHRVDLDGDPTPAKNRTGLVLEDGALRITAIEVDHAPITPAYAYRFDYKGRSVVVTGDLKYHQPLVAAATGSDILVSEAIAPSMTRALGNGARSGGRDRTAAIMKDIEDYHITPEQAARMANTAGVKLLVLYHLLPAPDGLLPRRLFVQGINEARQGDWTIADDGSLYTMPIGSKDVRIGEIER
jgi:ribonuclease Z